MNVGEETTATVALLSQRSRGWSSYSSLLGQVRSASDLLDRELGLLAFESLERAAREIAQWQARGIAVLSPSDPGFPESLRVSKECPPLLFVRGRLELLSTPTVAVVGARRATADGKDAAAAVAGRLLAAGFTVGSGLAAGIDTAAHLAALELGGPTVAVIGTGLDRHYPPENESLQQRIAESGAVVSRFWPDSPPSRQTFPMRNGVMAGMSIATVIVEAAETSGTRIQARMSLAAGRKVLLLAALLEQPWARELAERPGVAVFRTPAELDAAVTEARETTPWPDPDRLVA